MVHNTRADESTEKHVTHKTQSEVTWTARGSKNPTAKRALHNPLCGVSIQSTPRAAVIGASHRLRGRPMRLRCHTLPRILEAGLSNEGAKENNISEHP